MPETHFEPQRRRDAQKNIYLLFHLCVSAALRVEIFRGSTRHRRDAHVALERFASFLIASFFFASLSIAADRPRDLAPTLAPLVEKYHLPGAVGAILHGDTIVAIGSTGVRKIGDPTAFAPDDLIHLGSDTKAMTAILVGQLIDKKQIRFDSTMAELFPDLAAKMDPQMAKVTVRNLLTHTAGFPHDLDWHALPKKRHTAVQQALAVPPATPIGKFLYSNIGYVLLGAIVESKSNQSWEQAMQQEIFRPLKMDTAGFGVPGTIGKVEQPWGHIMRDGKLTPIQSDNPEVMGPAGTVHCTMTDWAKFIAEIMHGLQGHPTLVSAETFKELTRPNPDQDYAGGWIIATRPWAGGITLTHSGSNTMWFCTVWIAPKKNFAVMLATNTAGPDIGKAVDEGIGSLIQLNKNPGG